MGKTGPLNSNYGWRTCVFGKIRIWQIRVTDLLSCVISLSFARFDKRFISYIFSSCLALGVTNVSCRSFWSIFVFFYGEIFLYVWEKVLGQSTCNNCDLTSGTYLITIASDQALAFLLDTKQWYHTMIVFQGTMGSCLLELFFERTTHSIHYPFMVEWITNDDAFPYFLNMRNREYATLCELHWAYLFQINLIEKQWVHACLHFV